MNVVVTCFNNCVQCICAVVTCFNNCVQCICAVVTCFNNCVQCICAVVTCFNNCVQCICAVVTCFNTCVQCICTQFWVCMGDVWRDTANIPVPPAHRCTYLSACNLTTHHLLHTTSYTPPLTHHHPIYPPSPHTTHL